MPVLVSVVKLRIGAAAVPKLFACICPVDVMRRRSVGEEEPSAVVLKTSLPGISLAPGVPSTSPRIRAASTNSVPSAPWKLTVPR